METCVLCKGELVAGTTRHVVAFGDERVSVEVPAQVCRGCDESFVEGSDIERAELTVAAAIIASGQRNGPRFRFLRKAIGTSAKDLAAMFDVAPETISRWERGEREVDGLAWVALAGLVRERIAGRDDVKKILEAMRKPTPLPSLLALEVSSRRVAT
jgi:putative zinc finger/helix-turn-helix YgiT family protein